MERSRFILALPHSGASLLAMRDAVRAYLARLDMHDCDPMHIDLDDDATLALERDLRARLEAVER